MNPVVSIIIPLYNQGNFLKDAIASIQECKGYPYEVIIVNDGSTDAFTNDYARQLQAEGYQVIFQENKGLSAARNTGIAHARGTYILPLDADNKVMTPYLKDAVDIMEQHPEVGMVYSDTVYFDDEQGFREIGDFNLQRLMLFNYIDACALIRKSVLDKVGGFDTAIRHGMEDWEMWLRISFAGFRIHYLKAVGFHYRVRRGSMMRTTVQQYKLVNDIENHVNAKFPHHMGHAWVTENFVRRFKLSPLKMLVKIFLRCYWPSKYNELLAANKIRNGI